jgi:hypothetical protein
LPRAPLVGVEVTPYPDWYFFLVTMGLYFNLNVAALAMPIILWMIVCRQDLGRLGLTKS